MEQVVHKLGSTLLVDAMTDKLSNPSGDVNGKCNLVGVRVR